jgi:uncharacterized membrane protein YkoI
MKRRFFNTLFPAIAAMAVGLHAGDESSKQLSAAVQAKMQENLGGGHIDDIKVIRIDERLLYVIEIDLPGPRKRKLHLTGEGELLKIIDKLRLPDLPAPVREAMAPILANRGRFDGADRVTANGKVEYHIDFDLPGRVELLIVFSETGEVISRREEADL